MPADSQRTTSPGRVHSPYVSTGRGGAGNMRPSSGSRDSNPQRSVFGPEDHSQLRGREVPTPRSEKQRFFASGRGGFGNVHSPSRGAPVESRGALREEAKYVREHSRDGVPVIHGRGGAGNFSISRSRSRSRSRGQNQRSHSPEIPVDTYYGTQAPAVAPYSPGKGSKEDTANGQGQRHSSGVNKITNLFRRGSQGASGASPELPE